MKRFLLIFIFLLLACPVWATSYFPFFAGEAATRAYFALPNPTGTVKDLDTQIKILNAGGTVTLSGLTCKLSLVNGTAFVTQPSVDLRKYVGYKITLTASGQTLVGWIKAAGTPEGEMLGSDLLSGFDFTSGWINSESSTIIDFNSFTTIVIGGLRKNMLTAGMLYKRSYEKSTTATSSVFRISSAGGVQSPGDTDLQTGFKYSTVIPNYTHVYARNASAGTTDVTTFTIQQVLTPSETGVTIVNSQGGSTFNWVSDSGINPNSTSFTATITGE